MHGPDTLSRLNELACLPKYNHPKLHALVHAVQRLPIDGLYRAALLRSIDRYADQIIERPQYTPEEGWDDLEALQQVTLGDMVEASHRARARNGGG
ncbi:MAG: hypothetical protein NTV11_10220 [Rhodocyclales bacterium]|nr:hypothetical protein [Rhodocyclales bacterium]